MGKVQTRTKILVLLSFFYIIIQLFGMWVAATVQAAYPTHKDTEEIVKMLNIKIDFDFTLPEVDKVEQSEQKKEENLTDLQLPNTAREFKPYMDYRAITDTSSPQYQLQLEAYTDEDGLRRVGNAYCGALGSGLATGIGSMYRVSLSNGFVFDLILADQKDDSHTDATNTYCVVGTHNIIEFIVDDDALQNNALIMGDISGIDKFNGSIEKIERIDYEN